MNEFAPLTRPVQSQVVIDSVAEECPSEGFNYPNFRQLNKHARLYLSKPLDLSPSISYNLLDVANSKGWFVAVVQSSSGSDLIFSTLKDLRSAFSSAKEDPESLFTPKRTVSIPSKANIVKFACRDTRLLVGQDNGSMLVYDTSSLFTEGTEDVHPLTSTHIQTTYLRQIVPNPGTEPGLSELVAVVANGKVQLLNIQLEPQGGWAATDLMTQPIAVAWSPKGKHIAIGLQTGDILTYSLTNKSTPHKHIPPTANAILVSLNWLGPSHTFRTSYAGQGDSPSQQHIITLDTKTSTATYFSPDHPFPSADRTHQNAYTLSLPKWDADSASNDENKSLTIVGDVSSVDLEVLGNIGNSWYRQSQENQLSLPLDSSMDDTILLALESDLTDSSTAAPIMYAYLNDGSLQGWHLEHTKPYLGMITPSALSSTSQTPAQTQESEQDTDMGGQQSTISSAFGQQSTATSAFSQSSFGQQTSAFGQTGFGQKSPQSTPAFGQSSFGQPSPFGAMTGFASTPGFGQSNQSNTSTSGFGDAKPAIGFGAFGGSNNAFGSGASGAFGSNASPSAFSGLSSSTSNVFGQGSFGVSNQPSSGNASPSHSPAMTREASMSDSTPGFGGLSLGSATPSDDNAVNSMFGSFSTAPSATTTTSNQTSAFGGSIVKPASGFGAFGSFKPNSVFESTKPETPTTSPFGAPSQPPTSSGFGQSGFASPAFGKSSFGQPSFGKPSLGAPSASPAVSGGGFSVFANAPTTFGNAAQQQKPPVTTTTTSGAFSAFASAIPATFGTALAQTNVAESKPAPGGGFSAFASNTPSPFGSATTGVKPPPSSGGGFSAFASATPATFGPALGSLDTATDTSKTSPAAGGFGQPAPGALSPFAPASKPTEAPPTTSAFGAPKNIFGGESFPSTSSSAFETPARSPFANNNAGSPGESPQNLSISPPSSPEPSIAFKTPSSIATSGISGTSSSTPNAFSNLQTTPSSFRPASGFGAFGSLETSKSSPFFKKPDESPTPVSVFGLGISPKVPAGGAAAPTFGSTSALGGPKSAFAPITTATTTPTKAPATGGFSAFSGASTGFSAFAGAKTSFSDLLKTGGEEVKDPMKPTPPVAPAPSPKPDEDKKPQAPTSVFGTPTTPPKKEAPPVVSAFAPISKDEEKESGDKKPVSGESSFASISASSASSSFVDVSAEETRGDEHSDEDAEHSGDDTNSFLSENFSDSYEEEESADEGLDKEELPEEGRSPSPESTAVPPQLSRSPSATPQPETPSIEVSPSSDVDEAKSLTLSPVRESSTTPPGTPAKEPKSLFGTAPPLATPTTTPGPSPFGLGLGRPSTRPTRSSPLANAISHADESEEEEEEEEGEEKEEEEEAEDEEAEKKPAVSPKPPVEVLPLKLGDDEKEEPPTKRPKTPPLLSTLGGIVTPTGATFLAPATPLISKSPSVSTESSTSSTKSSRPGTPPFGFGTLPTAAASSPGLFGRAPESRAAFPKPDVARPASVPASLFGATALPAAPKPAFSMPPFSLKEATVASTPSTGTSGPFGIKSPTLPPMPGQSVFGAPSAPQPPVSLFGAGQKQPSTTPMPPLFGSPAPKSTQPQVSSPFSLAPSPPSVPKVQRASVPIPPTPTPEAILEEGMQKECINLVTGMSRDLTELAQLSRAANTRRIEMSTSAGGSPLKADLGVPQKWSFGDFQQFAQVLQQYQADLDLLSSQREKDQQTLREIQSNMLKAGTRREEIARFNKAKSDKEFAKILRSRTLGPEHSETQTHLRKNIRAIRDRIQKLETHLQEDKKKLAQSTSCKPSFRAPSLDTINRTYRNIEIAIEQQSDEVARLASRVAKLNIKQAVDSSPSRDARLPDIGRRRPYNVTPNVAVTTAAALNAERSAQRLKKALLSVRAEPLLNTKAASAPCAPVAFTTPKKSSSSSTAFAFQTPITGPLFSEPLTPDAIPDWNIPEDNFNPTPSTVSSGRRGAGGQRKHQSVPLKRSMGSTPVTPTPAGFEWGPLPSFSSPPASSVPRSFVPISTSPSAFGKK
ncbi:hypothetical protein BDZ97DRAFT_1796720 [Flammula alnicola]|nr:hypothetical protein BDZ97DRAFT_1796720 [Flammula alnicola]